VMEDFSDSVIIVTGACGGIGESIVRKFADAGALLGLCDIDGSALPRLATELSASGKTHHAAIDVTDQDAVRAFCDSTVESLGDINHLINTVDNAGDVIDLPLEVWDRTLAVNLTSSFLMAKHAVPHMVYSVTKVGMISLTKSHASTNMSRTAFPVRNSVIGPTQRRCSSGYAATTRRFGRFWEARDGRWVTRHPAGANAFPPEGFQRF